MNKKESEIFNSTLKKINKKYNDAFNQCKLSNSKITTYYSLKKNFSDISLKKIDLKENNKNKILGKIQKLKLDSLFKRTKFNSEYSLKKNASIENIMNIQNQRLYSNSNSIDNSSKSHRNLIIENLLNKRISKLNRPKSPKLKIDESDIIEKLKKSYGEKIFSEKYEKRFQQKERPIKYYLKKNKKIQIQAKLRKNIKSLSLCNKNNKAYKDDYYKKINWPVYETIEFRDQKIIYANKLVIEEKDPNSEDVKNNIVGSLSGSRINSRYLARYFTKRRNKNINSIKNLNELKLKNIKELEKMKRGNFININNSIINNREIIRTNRVKYKSFIDKMSKKFNKCVEEICKNDL